jgi:hypothetical protein
MPGNAAAHGPDQTHPIPAWLSSQALRLRTTINRPARDGRCPPRTRTWATSLSRVASLWADELLVPVSSVESPPDDWRDNIA